MDCEFHAAVLSWSDAPGFRRKILPIPERSEAIHISGSGKKAMQTAVETRRSSPAGRTTRALFRALVDSLERGSDPKSGGAPQLVGLYRIDPAHSFGVLYRDKRFLHGMPVQSLAPDSRLSWRNELFERASGSTRGRLPGAQVHQDLKRPRSS